MMTKTTPQKPETKAEPKAVTISVMGREFRVGAPAGEERQLMASVDLLNEKMKEIRDSGKVVGNERIAIMAALNLAHEHLHSANASHTSTEKRAVSGASQAIVTIDEAYVRGKMNTFESIIDKAITDQEKLF
jgi:cell division protein ZapA (FtsZ GTPase activity inhibitor)